MLVAVTSRPRAARRALRAAAAAFLILRLAASFTGAEAIELVRVATDRVLHPPVEAALGPRCGVYALAAEGEAHQLALYRSDSLATHWERWALLPQTAAGAIGLAITPHAALVVAVPEADTTHPGPGTIWVASVPLDAPAPAEALARFTCVTTPAPVLALAFDASFARPDSVAAAHLAYLTAAADTIPRLIEYCRSTDDGLTWSTPQTMARDSVGLPALFARSQHPSVVDLTFARAGFMRWRGGNRHGARWGPEQAVRLGVLSDLPGGVARASRRVFILSESDVHQIVGAPSPNGGVNWERTIALARASDRPRMPSLDWGGGRFWIAYAQGDSLVLARSAANPGHPSFWSPPIPIARTRCVGSPAIVALPDSTAIVVFAAPEGVVWSARARATR